MKATWIRSSLILAAMLCTIHVIEAAAADSGPVRATVAESQKPAPHESGGTADATKPVDPSAAKTALDSQQAAKTATEAAVDATKAAETAYAAACKADATKCKAALLDKDIAPAPYASFGFGVGIGLNWVGKRDIQTATLTSTNVVDTSDSESVKKQIWLESHWLWFADDYKWDKCTDENCAPYDYTLNKPVPLKFGDSYMRPRRWQPGLFFAIQVSDADSLINGAALGLMSSFKKTYYVDGKPKTRAFNLGLGVSSQKIQRLGKGLKEGDTVAAGTPITYRKDDRTGVLLLFSVNVF